MAAETLHPNAAATDLASAPARFAAAVTPSDSTDLSFVSRGLYVGTTGDVTVIMAGNGATVTFPSVPSGWVLPIAVSRVNATLTTASGIRALW